MTVSLADVRGVVFDMDDTLYAEVEFVRGGFAAVAAEAGDRFSVDAPSFEAALERELERVYAGTARSGHIFDRVLEEHGVPVDLETIAWLVSIYRGHRPELRPFDDVLPTLETLSGRVRIGLITDGPGVVQRAKFAALGLAPLFDATLFTDDLGQDHWKPSEHAYETMEHALGLEGSQLVYVADNPVKDFVGARARGWRTLRIRRPGGLHSRAEPEPGHEPDGEIETLGELLVIEGTRT